MGRGCCCGLNGLSHEIVHDGIRRVGSTELQGRVRIDWTTRDTAGRTHDEPSAVSAAAATGVLQRLTFVGVGTLVPKMVDTQKGEKDSSCTTTCHVPRRRASLRFLELALRCDAEQIAPGFPRDILPLTCPKSVKRKPTECVRVDVYGAAVVTHEMFPQRTRVPTVKTGTLLRPKGCGGSIGADVRCPSFPPLFLGRVRVSAVPPRARHGISPRPPTYIG